MGAQIHTELRLRGHTVLTLGRRESDDVRWDLQQPLGDTAARALESVDVLIHSAADIRLTEPIESLRRVNVEPLRDLVARLGAMSAPPRLLLVSSAFAEPGSGGGHNNNYERSKFEAEQVLGAAGLDYSVLRPSLVIGARPDGVIKRFSGVYGFLRMLRLGLIPAIPGFTHVGVDVIPVDIVAQRAADEVEKPSGNTLVRITSGDAAPSIETLVTIACDLFEAHSGQAVDRPKFVSPEVYHRLFRPLILEKLSSAQRVMLQTVEIFLPYFERDHVFPSDVMPSRSDVVTAWARSVQHWLGETGYCATRGREVWAKKN